MKVEYWECVYCNKNMNDVQGTTCKSSKSPDGKHYYTLKVKEKSSESFELGVKLGELLFSKPKSMIGLITRGVIFAVIGFFVASSFILDALNSEIVSYTLGILAGVAVFGLYFWFFKRKV